jgi:hypothetical protein
VEVSILSTHKRTYLVFALFALLLIPSPGFAQQSAPTVPVTTTITILGPDYAPAPEIAKSDVSAYSDKTKLTITRWEHAQSNGGDLQFAILIDDAIRTSLAGSQLSDLSNFINSLPPNSTLGVFYAQNGSAATAAPFGTEHPKAAQSLHLTFGGAGDSPSIYLSLADLAKEWPASAQPGARREVLVLSSGNDLLNPGVQDPYLDSTIDALRKADITVHTIYVGSGRFGNSFRGSVSQGKLFQVSEETGGQPLNGLPSAPVSLAPFLTDLKTVLSNQYVLTVTTEASRKKEGDFRPLQIRTEERHLKITAPSHVFVPMAS